MNVAPITENCSRAFDTRAHAVLGISPFNSYFSEDRIKRLAAWALATFDAVHLFVPDAASALTLQAVGYPPEKAERKARRQANYLKNKIRRALAALGVSIADAGDMIVSSERLEGNERYRSKLEESRQVFAEDADFHRDCLASSSWVLENQSNGKPAEGPSLRLAANYLLAEMPLFVDSVGILEQDASVFCYHRCIPLISDLYRGRYGLRPSVNQGFTVLPDLAVKLSA